MSDHDDYRVLAEQLAEERARLTSARSNYETIIRSRFHGLRMLWFSLKHVLGKTTPNDVFAAWSPGIRIAPRALPAGGFNVGALSDAERAVVAAWNHRIETTPPNPPIVSVVIPVLNNLDTTLRCLQSVATSWFDSLSVQFILVDDGSTDGTAALITQLKGIDYVRSAHNEGFIHACNRGAALARGKYVCFLNNHTIVCDGWLDHLVNTAQKDEQIGVVGAKLVLPNGRLQGAGAIVWRDGSGRSVGRNESPDDPRYNYVRDVDYVSGAVLLVDRELFHRVGGFAVTFAPAYYEDADLCFAVRSLGYRVVYQPKAVVIHEEGVTSSAERSDIKRFQEINRAKFREKWVSQLANHLENEPESVARASLPVANKKSILIIDSYVPLHDQEAGSQRIFRIIKMLLAADYNVSFLPDNHAAVQPYTDTLQQMGVQVLHQSEGRNGSASQDLEKILPALDVAWICRPQIFQKYAPIIRRNKSVHVIYDTVDLHHVRMQRKAAVTGVDDRQWQEWQRIEQQCAESADTTIVVSPEEKHALGKMGVSNIIIVPTIHEPAHMPRRRFEDTSGLLFIGNYNHPPNVDAVKWFCDEVMPLVRVALPDVGVVLAGANPSDAVRQLKSPFVSVTGYVPDIASLFRKSRLFVAPLRFGAGMKGKIGQALEYGLPIVTTPVGAEGFDLRSGENAVIAESQPQAFADAILGIYSNRELWLNVSRQAASSLESFSPIAVMPRIAAMLESTST